MTNGKFGCAIIGYGGMGKWHAAKLVKELGEYATLMGVYDIKVERNEEAIKAGIKAYDSLDELLADEAVDLVTIATPNDVHEELVIKALEAGKNVICEKPVTLDIYSLARMTGCADGYGKLFTVHQNRRWDRDFLTIKKIFDNNMLGPVFRIESRVQGSRGIPGDWRNKKSHGGGMVYDWGIHLFDQMLMMTAHRKIKSVYAELTHVTNEECDDGFRVTTIFDDGLSFYVEVGTSNFISLPRWYMLGENGSAVIEGWDCRGKIVMVEDWENKDAVPIVAGAGLTKTMAPRTDNSIKEKFLPLADSDWGEYYKNVFATLKGEQSIIVTHKEQFRLMEFVQTIFKSAKTSQAILFESGF